MHRWMSIGGLLALVVLIAITSFGYTIHRTYEWSFQERTWTWPLSFGSEAYQLFKGLPRIADYSIYVTNPYDDQFLASLINSVKEAAEEEGYNERETVDFLIAFVQSLPYTSDRVTSGYDAYPRYPLETLVDEGGDCEDTAILTAALLQQMNYDVILLKFPRHLAVGVWSDEIPGGTYYRVNGRDYYFLETTGEGWTIGEEPEGLPSTAEIIKLVPKPLLSFSWRCTPTSRDINSVTYRVEVTVNNWGSATSYGTRCYVAFEANPGRVWDQEESDPLTIQSLSNGIFSCYLECPRGEWTRLRIDVWSNNHPSISDQSKRFTP